MAKPLKSKHPEDLSQWAAQAVTSATGMAPPTGVLTALLKRQGMGTKGVYTKKNPAAVALGRLGGLKGGKARADSLSATKRSAIARKAAKARWKGKAATPAKPSSGMHVIRTSPAAEAKWKRALERKRPKKVKLRRERTIHA